MPKLRIERTGPGTSRSADQWLGEAGRARQGATWNVRRFTDARSSEYQARRGSDATALRFYLSRLRKQTSSIDDRAGLSGIKIAHQFSRTLVVSEQCRHRLP